MRSLKNTALATILATTLTACGGGGGGGPAGDINNFVQEDLSNLNGSASLVSSYSNLLTDFNSVVSGGNFSAFQTSILDSSPQKYPRGQVLRSLQVFFPIGNEV